MFLRTSKTRDTEYVMLVEAYRDENGKPKQRQVARLGRLDDFGDTGEKLVASLNKLLGKDTSEPLSLECSAARSVGGTWALQQLWNQLGLSAALRKAISAPKRTYDPVDALRIMVFNRLCDPQSKLGVLRWLEETVVPEVRTAHLTHQHLLRSMDAVEQSLDAIRDALASQIKPLLDQDVTVAFYDLTTIRVHGTSEQEDDLRQFGLSKELKGGIARQYMLAVVQSECGMPLDFCVFEGNQGEVQTLVPVLSETFARYRIKRAVIVADRGLLSLDNVAQLDDMKLDGSSDPVQYIVAVPTGRYKAMAEVFDALTYGDEPTFHETTFNGRRMVVTHDPQRAKMQCEAREAKIQTLCDWADKRAAKLDKQDEGKTTEKGRRASDRGTYNAFHKKVTEAKLSRYIRCDLDAERFSYTLDEGAMRAARKRDGTLCVVTNIAAGEMNSQQAIARYKALADIETGFRVLKSELDIAPVHHRLPRRLQAHSAICFIALLMHRLMRRRLRQVKSPFSPEAALAQLKRLQQHHVTINGVGYHRLGTVTPEQLQLFKDLGIKKPKEAILY